MTGHLVRFMDGRKGAALRWSNYAEHAVGHRFIYGKNGRPRHTDNAQGSPGGHLRPALPLDQNSMRGKINATGEERRATGHRGEPSRIKPLHSPSFQRPVGCTYRRRGVVTSTFYPFSGKARPGGGRARTTGGLRGTPRPGVGPTGSRPGCTRPPPFAYPHRWRRVQHGQAE